MKLLGIIFLSGFLALSFGAQKLRVKSDKVSIFQSKGGNGTKGTLNSGEEVLLISKSDNRTMIKTANGVKGWVDNAAVEYIKSNNKGDTYNLDAQEVTGWLDNPSAIYILDNSGLENDALPLTRSFDDEIFEMQDKETLERGNDEN